MLKLRVRVCAVHLTLIFSFEMSLYCGLAVKSSPPLALFKQRVFSLGY